MKFISRDKHPVPPCHDTVHKLRSKHPERNDDAISDEEFQNLISLSETVFDRLGSSRDILNITGDRIRKIIMKRPKLKRAGIDKSRYDHLQTLIGFGGEIRDGIVNAQGHIDLPLG